MWRGLRVICFKPSWSDQFKTGFWSPIRLCNILLMTPLIASQFLMIIPPPFILCWIWVTMPPISVLTCPLPIYDQSLGLYPLNPLSSQFSGKNLWNDSVQSSDFKMVKMKSFVQHSSEVYSQHTQNLCTIFMFWAAASIVGILTPPST